ncbi:MAG: hypoxanthine phosphoribosyltransferase [Bacillota bacterium]|nr:hypoxanthine phosphoribosyltransferase [Bacillota bacterium]
MTRPGELGDVLISEAEIRAMIRRIADEISNDYAGREVLLVGVLKGAFMFMADLVRELKVASQVDFMAVSSYGKETKSSGVVRILKDLDEDITGRHVIIVEDIIDSGLTWSKLRELLLTRGPASLALCAAFDKPSRRKVANLKVDYTGLEIPDAFIVGYGLDYQGFYRDLPDVRTLRLEAEN